MLADIVRQIDEDIARLETARLDIDRQIERFRKARENLIADADPNAPRAAVEPLGGPFVARTPKTKPKGRTKPKGGRRAKSAHAVMRDRVLHAMQVSGAETHSEIMAVLGLGTPHRYEVANALRDLRDHGLIERTGQTGEPISGRGRAPERHRVVAPAAASNSGQHRNGNGVRKASG